MKFMIKENLAIYLSSCVRETLLEWPVKLYLWVKTPSNSTGPCSLVVMFNLNILSNVGKINHQDKLN